MRLLIIVILSISTFSLAVINKDTRFMYYSEQQENILLRSLLREEKHQKRLAEVKLIVMRCK